MPKDKRPKQAPTATKSKPGLPAPLAGPSSFPPAWPPFKPTLLVADLNLESIIDDQVVVFRNFWPRSLCRDYVAFLKTLPLITTPGKPKRGDAVRVNDRFEVHDAAFAERLWRETGLREALEGDVEGEPEGKWGAELLGLSPRIRIYRYSKGQFFAAHYDDSNTLSFVQADTAATVPAKTTWTLLLYLTSAADGCAGGATVFYPHDRRVAREEVAIPPETGMLLLHRHGDACMLHEGREVTDGEKWVLRSDLVVRK